MQGDGQDKEQAMSNCMTEPRTVRYRAEQNLCVVLECCVDIPESD